METPARFYTDQSIGSVFDLLVVQPPIDTERAEDIIVLLEAVGRILDQGHDNLPGYAVEDFVRIAVAELRSIDAQMHQMGSALAEAVPVSHRDRVLQAARAAASSLAEYREWLSNDLHGVQSWSPIGEKDFRYFLSEVALLPFSSSRLLDMGAVELDRAVALSEVCSRRADAAAIPPLFEDVTAQIERERQDELAVRRFYVERGLLSQPTSLGHYLFVPMPAYISPLTWLGVTDDLTSDSRLDQDGVRYVPEPRPGLAYFYDANARDPRLGIIHEGVHYQQLALSWAPSRPGSPSVLRLGGKRGPRFLQRRAHASGRPFR